MSTTRKLIIGLTTLVVLICVGIWIIKCINIEKLRQKSLREWRIIPQQQWPEGFLELLRKAEEKHLNFGEITVLHQPYSGAYVWKSDFSSELLELMIARWKLSSVDKNHKLLRLVLNDLPSAFSTLSEANDTACYYISADWLADEERHQYCVINDKNKKRIIIRYSYHW